MTSARAGKGEAGSAAVELVVLTPALVVLVLFVVLLGRYESARSDVAASAREGARAASTAYDAAAAATQGNAAAKAAFASTGLTCTKSSVSVNTSGFGPAAQVSVVVHCTVPLSDLGLLGVPSAKTFSASFVEPVDTFRSSNAS